MTSSCQITLFETAYVVVPENKSLLPGVKVIADLPINHTGDVTQVWNVAIFSDLWSHAERLVDYYSTPESQKQCNHSAEE